MLSFGFPACLAWHNVTYVVLDLKASYADWVIVQGHRIRKTTSVTSKYPQLALRACISPLVSQLQGRLILSNKIARTIAFFYTLFLHCLVFLVSLRSLTVYCLCKMLRFSAFQQQLKSSIHICLIGTRILGEVQ